MPQPTMPVQAPPDVHTWGDRLREVSETLIATTIVGGVLLRLGVAHVDRWLFGWLRRNPDRAKAEITKLLDEHLAPIKALPIALDRLTRATRMNARATRENTAAYVKLESRVSTSEAAIARLDERTKHPTQET